MFVPSLSTALTVTLSTSGSSPFQLTVSPFDGDPLLISPAGATTGVTPTGDPLTTGGWYLIPAESGPFGAGGKPPEEVQISAAAMTKALNTAVTSSTGDLWWFVVAFAYDPDSWLLLGPGQTGPIQVGSAPSGTPGTSVSGTLYLDDASLVSTNPTAGNYPNANTVATIPYRYQVGG